MPRFSGPSFALGLLAGPLVLSARQEPFPRPPSPFPAPQAEEEKGLSPRERWRRKLERDLEGVWEVERISNPSYPFVDTVQGYFLFYREYAAYTLTATARSSVFTGAQQNLFQSGFKKYTVTEEGRFLLQNLIGVQRLGTSVVERPLGGEIEERDVFFEEDTLRISHTPDDYVQMRKVHTAPPAPRKPFPRPRALTPPGPAEKPAGETPTTMPGRKDG